MKSRPKPQIPQEEEVEEDDEVPALVNRDLASLGAVVDAADVLLQVIDARDPLEYRSKALEGVAKDKKKHFAFVLTKIGEFHSLGPSSKPQRSPDLCPRETISAWLSHLRSEYPTFPFKSATAFLPDFKGKGKEAVSDGVGADALLGFLRHIAKEKNGTAPLTVAVSGVTNVGKSSFINSLVGRSALPIYRLSDTSRGATTTELPQEVEVDADGKQIRIIDTPGLAFEHDAEAGTRGRDILLRNRGRIDKLKDPSPPLSYIVSRAKNEDLMLLYNLPAFAENDPNAFLAGVARSHRLIKKVCVISVVPFRFTLTNM